MQTFLLKQIFKPDENKNGSPNKFKISTKMKKLLEDNIKQIQA